MAEHEAWLQRVRASAETPRELEDTRSNVGRAQVLA
jgi:hypothetical protein